MQPALVRPGLAPYRPAAQLLHDPAPPTLYEPTPHIAAVALVDPAAHAYPALQFPVHVAFTMPDAAPYTPAAHGPVHAVVFRLAVSPY